MEHKKSWSDAKPHCLNNTRLYQKTQTQKEKKEKKKNKYRSLRL